MPPVVRRQPLVKQTYSAWVNIDNSVRKWHMSEYTTSYLLPSFLVFFFPFPKSPRLSYPRFSLLLHQSPVVPMLSQATPPSWYLGASRSSTLLPFANGQSLFDIIIGPGLRAFSTTPISPDFIFRGHFIPFAYFISKFCYAESSLFCLAGPELNKR